MSWKVSVNIYTKFIRPADAEHLIGDNAKACKALGWKPKVDFTGLIKMMVDADLARVAVEPPLGARLSPL